MKTVTKNLSRDLEKKKISKEDMDIFRVMDEPEEIVDYIKRFVIL
jgi:predicted Rossmann-fold nucleotide-binding protein